MNEIGTCRDRADQFAAPMSPLSTIGKLESGLDFYGRIEIVGKTSRWNFEPVSKFAV